MLEDIDNDFSYRDRKKRPDEIKNWINISSPNDNTLYPNRWENWRKKLVNVSRDSDEAGYEPNYTHPIVREGNAVIVKSNKSKMSRFFKWVVGTLLWKWLFSSSSKDEQILNKHKIRKSKTMKRIKVNTVRHQNSRHLSDVTHSKDVRIKIIEN